MPPERSKEKVRSRSVCAQVDNQDEERWEISYSEYVMIMLAAKRYVLRRRIFVSSDELIDYVNDVFVKIQGSASYKAMLKRLSLSTQRRYILRCIANRINDDFRRQRVHTKYSDLTRPTLNDTALSPQDGTPFEIDISLVVPEIMRIFGDDKQALRLLSFLLNGNFVATNGNRRGRFVLERISAQIGWPPEEVIASLRRI